MFEIFVEFFLLSRSVDFRWVDSSSQWVLHKFHPLKKINERYVLHSGWKSQKKVSFNIVSEASYVYIWTKMVHLGEFLKNVKLVVKECYQTDQF